MADQNLDPELIERINRELATYGQLTAKTAEDLTNAQTGIKNFDLKMRSAGGAASALADAFVTYNKEVYKGASANQAAAASADKLADAAKYAGAFLALLVPGGPIVKALVGSLGLLTAKALEAGKAIAEQTDQVYKAYQDMARIGATGAGGMQDVFNSLQKVGLGTEKFGAYIKLVNENANDLAMFSGTVRSGRKIFESTMASFSTNQRVEMEQMGLNREAQAEATMAYIKQQRLLTMGTKAQMDTSSAAVMRYIKETDELTRITGANREEQQKLLDKAMSEEIFAAYLDSLEEQGEEGRALAKQYRDNNVILEKTMGPDFARGIRDSITGFIGASNAASKAFMGSGGASAEYAAMMQATGSSANEARKALDLLIAGTANNYQQLQKNIAQLGVSETVFGRVAENRRAVAVEQLGIEKSLLKADEERKKQLEDSTTYKMAAAENAVRQTQLELQRLLNLGMDIYVDKTYLAAEANRELVFRTGKLTEGSVPELETTFGKLFNAMMPFVDQLSKFVNDKVIPKLQTEIERFTKFLERISGAKGAEEVTKASGELGIAETVGKYGGAYAGLKGGAALGAGIGTVFGPLGTGIGTVLGGAAGAAAGYFGLGAMGRLADEAARKGEFGNARLLGNTSDEMGFGTGLIPGKAAGGPVSARTPYLVGEEGPELFVPSIAGDIVPTDRLRGTTGSALKQSQMIESMVSRIVLDTTLLSKTSALDAERADLHSVALEKQREKIDRAIKEIALNSEEINQAFRTELTRSQDYNFAVKQQREKIFQSVKEMALGSAALDTALDTDLERSRAHHEELKGQRQKISQSLRDISVASVELDRTFKSDLQRAKSYSEFYRKFTEVKTLLEKQQLQLLVEDLSAAKQPTNAQTVQTQRLTNIDASDAVSKFLQSIDLDQQQTVQAFDKTSGQLAAVVASLRDVKTLAANLTDVADQIPTNDQRPETEVLNKSIRSFLIATESFVSNLDDIDNRLAGLELPKKPDRTLDSSVINLRERSIERTVNSNDRMATQLGRLFKDLTGIIRNYQDAQLAQPGKETQPGYGVQPPTEPTAGQSTTSGGLQPRSGMGLQPPTRAAQPAMGGAQGLQIKSQEDLAKMGLKIKTGDVQAEGAGISPTLIELAKKIQAMVPGFRAFTGFNDRFHREKAPSSQHTKGLALDFALVDIPTAEDGRAITDWLKSQGASLAIDEYNNPSRQSTGGHIHAQIPQFEDGGTLGADRVGIAGEAGKPELITGPADITPMNDLMRAFGTMTNLLEISVGKLDAIARATAGTQDASARMLNYAQN